MGRTILMLLCVTIAPLALASPSTVALQGRLLNGAGLAAPDGEYGVLISFLDAPNQGTKLWEEIQSGDQAVKVANGHFSVVLGLKSAINAGVLVGAKEVWVEVSVSLEPPLPRQRLNAAPFAMVSGDLACSGCVRASELNFKVYSAAQIDGMLAPFLDAAAVDKLVDAKGYASAADLAKVASSGSFADLENVPADLADGDKDTQLSEAQVDKYVANNGYAMLADLANVALSGSFTDLKDVPADGLAGPHSYSNSWKTHILFVQ